MAWTAPATYSVSEVVTAAKLNTHIRDNLDYLKGNAGAVVISDTLRATGLYAGIAPPSYASLAVGSNAEIYIHNVVPNTVNGGGSQNVDNIDLWFNYTGYNGSTTRDRNLLIGDGKNNQIASFIGSTRNVGIGVAAPQGRVHGYDTISGFMHWKYDGVDGTARTVIPDGTGDVQYYVTGFFVVRASSGALGASSSLGILSPGVNQDIYNSGGNICQFQVAANGSVTVQRTAGALTYKVGLWLLWL